jgi:hypothetical protein
MKSVLIATIINLIIIIAFAGCSTSNITAQAPSSVSSTIVCEVFYRSTPGQSLQSAPLISFSEGSDAETLTFDTMVFEAHFQDDEYEGRALSIAITDLDTGSDVTRQLYQFDRQNPVKNQFVGGHGFTGLNYIFQKDTSAEMQFFCSIQ